MHAWDKIKKERFTPQNVTDIQKIHLQKVGIDTWLTRKAAEGFPASARVVAGYRSIGPQCKENIL